MSDEKIRVIQGYTGKIAREQIRMLVQRPEVELVGALVHHAEKSGRDVGEIAEIDPIGVRATDSLEEILALEEVLEVVDRARADGETPEDHAGDQEDHPEAEVEDQRDLQHRPRLDVTDQAPDFAGAEPAGDAASQARL